MAERQPLDEQERADLVAYLDGELKGEAARALEAKLQQHPEARAEAESLKRAWDLLDYLPRAEPSPAFTERTLSRLAVPTGRVPVARRRLWVVAWAVGVLAAFAAGWAGYGLLAPLPPEVHDHPDQRFLNRLPAAVRRKVQDLPPEQLGEAVAALREEERRNVELWQRQARASVPAPAAPAKLPASPNELPLEVKAHVERFVLPRLSEDEKRRLQNAEGKADVYLRVLAELADRHPVLPPLPAGPITRLAELPPRAKDILHKAHTDKLGKILHAKLGKWPDFALACVELVPAGQRTDFPPLGASRPREFSPEVQAALAILRDKHPDDAAWLRKAEGHWPDYPQRLLEVARKNKLPLPGLSLPGPRELWEHR